MSRAPWPRIAHAFRRVALPLASYYVVTLALPLANGAALSGAFMEHALVVLVVPPIAVMLACAVHTACARTRQCPPCVSRVKGYKPRDILSTICLPCLRSSIVIAPVSSRTSSTCVNPSGVRV